MPINRTYIKLLHIFYKIKIKKAKVYKKVTDKCKNNGCLYILLKKKNNFLKKTKVYLKHTDK